MTEPTDAEIDALWRFEASKNWDSTLAMRTSFTRAVLDKWGTPAPVGVEPVALITVETSLRFRLANAKEDVEQLEVENRELRGRVAELKAANQVLAMGRVPQVDAAAKALAECMDYPWEHMPEAGRQAMREHAQTVLSAAHGIKQGGQHGAE